MIYFIDTNIFIRVFVIDDKNIHKDCVKLLSLIVNGKIKAFISNLILTEIQWVLGKFYRFSKDRVLLALKSIIQTKNLSIKDNFKTNLAIELFEEYNAKFIDCLIASNLLIQNKKAQIISYDEDFDILKVKRLEPKELLKFYKQ